jgi:tRNA-dihydrouridine synthase B
MLPMGEFCIAIVKKLISKFSTVPLDNEPRMFAMLESHKEPSPLTTPTVLPEYRQSSQYDKMQRMPQATTHILQPFYLGTISIDPPVLLAPMAGHTHVGFRTLVRELGSCGLVCSELISSHVLKANPKSRKTRALFDWSEREWPFAVQLFGSDPKEMAHAAQVVEGAGAPVVDINMGCWVPKVAKKGCGAALLKDLDHAALVVQAVCRAVEVPVSVKIRIGFQQNEPTAVPFALAACEAGAKMVTVHGRYARQGFKGVPDHSVTAAVKDAVGDRMRVIANGDIVDTPSAVAVIRETGCDGIMVGRECLRRPWMLSQLAHDLCGRPAPARNYHPVLIARRQFELARELVDKPEKVVVRELRGQLLPYRLGAPSNDGSKAKSDLEIELRQDLVRAESFEDLERFLERALERTQGLY